MGRPWHQDRTIAVKQRFDVPDYGPWTVKHGVDHVEPPRAILQHMLTVRLFVDDCNEDNGPLHVVVGSHHQGRIAGGEMSAVVQHGPVFVATGRAGDVLLMKTLAVHSSRRATAGAHRRVLHVDYATMDLPAPLEWMLSEAAAAIR